MSWKRMATALILAGLSCALKAEEPRRLADINVAGPDPDAFPPVAGGFVPFDDRLIFPFYGTSGDDGTLWSSDGTPAGTAPLPVSLCPAPCEFLAMVGVVKGGALLEARSNASGLHVTRLWRTDGTAAGTFPLTRSIGFVEERIVLDDPSRGLSALYFTACREVDSCQLWRTDGSRAGTRIVREFHEGNSNHGPHAFHVWGDRLAFIADDGEGAALWITDGTSGGTVRLAPIPDSERGVDFTQFLAVTPSRLFFTSGYLSELWVTDGTPAGTRQLHVFREAVCPNHYYCEDAYTDALVPFGDEVYFTAAELGDASGEVEIWKSDGSEAGTVRVTRMPPLPEGQKPFAGTLRRTGGRWFLLVGFWSGGSLWASEGDLAAAAPVAGCEGGCPQDIRFVGDLDAAGRQLFLASDGAHGAELWVTDGTGTGTHRLTDTCPGPCSGFSRLLGSFPGGTYFLAAPEGTEGPQDLWVTDGTAGGTHRVAGSVSALAAFQGATWFTVAGPGSFSNGIWRTDGTPAETRQAVDLRLATPGSSPMIFPRREGGALMLAWDGTSQRLWRSDGTPAGTVALGGLALDPESDSLEVEPIQVGPLQFFGIQRLKGDPDDPELFHEIWRTDGTTRGTFRVANLKGDFYYWDLGTAWNGKLLFEVQGPEGCSFWTSDGTREGTGELFPLRRGVRCGLAARPFGSRFLFIARAPGDYGRELNVAPQLFLSDGTAAGTRQLSRVQGPRGAYAEFIQVGETILFQIDNEDSSGVEIWRTDGTPKGTRKLLSPPEVGNLYSFRGSLYVLTTEDTETSRSRLWRVPLDGGSPVLLHADAAQFGGLDSGFLAGLAPMGDRVLFAARDAAHGFELWSTDGTPGGTRIVRDILPGPGSSLPGELTAAGGRVFFSAHDGAHGWELWESDGTAEGTRMVSDLNPGPLGSAPTGLTVSGPTLFFSADDSVAGREPWVLSLQSAEGSSGSAALAPQAAGSQWSDNFFW